MQPASRPEFGDLQIAGCLQLAKPLGKSPATWRRSSSMLWLNTPTWPKVEIAGPGYVNLHLTSECLGRLLQQMATSPSHGVRPRYAGQTVIVDFRRRTSPSRCTSATSVRRSSGPR